MDGCLEEIGLDVNKPWVILHPGSTAPSRRYPPQSFARVAQRLAFIARVQVLFTGTKPERDLIESIRETMQANSFSLAGRLGIDEFAALISKAPLLISNNTGPVHMAAALNTPVVDLYALTNPQHTPWMVPTARSITMCPANIVIRASARWGTITVCGWFRRRMW